MVLSNTAFPRNFGHYLLSFSHQQERLMRIMNEALWVLKCENTRLLHIDIKSISAPYFKIWEVKWELFTILIQTFKKYIYCTIFKEIVISKEQKDWKKTHKPLHTLCNSSYTSWWANLGQGSSSWRLLPGFSFAAWSFL